MHIVESHSLNSYLKFSKPEIYTKMYPVSSNKYLLLDMTPCEKSPSDIYPLWDEVLSILVPILKQKNIDIIVLGNLKTNPFNLNVINPSNINENQFAFLIQNSNLYISSNSFGAAIASSFNCKNIYLENNKHLIKYGPVLSEENKKFCVNYEKINQIKPETISTFAFKLLDINIKSPIETIQCGDFYSDNIYLDIIPDAPVNNNFKTNMPCHIRYDLINEKNTPEAESNVAQILSLQKSNLLTNKPINKDLLYNFRDQLETIVYDITDGADIDFAKFLCTLNNVVFLFNLNNDNEEQLSERKLLLIDLPILITIQKIKIIPENIKQNWSSLCYFTNKVILSKNKFFYSIEDWKKDNDTKTFITKHPVQLNTIKNRNLFWKENSEFSFFFLFKS